ncbi:MAG TPA: zeta toxin family protein [Steroidobacteraceae bacterium]|nr:zeta toxin family protein [Steroidobacteraceae bacterium]
MSELLHALLDDIAALRRRREGHPVVIGICGSQGSGKTTLAAGLQTVLTQEQGANVAVLSIDDLYLPARERARLAHAVHPLLGTRGVPGTHEIVLGLALINRLTHCNPDARTPLPRFDKLADDRLPLSAWPEFAGRADVVLLEGWCVGARPQPEEQLAAPVNALERNEDPDGRWRRYVNAQLGGSYQALFGLLDRLVLLAAPDFDVVFRWRRQQEHALAAAAAAAAATGAQDSHAAPRTMTDAQLARFIMHYERLTRFILSEMPERADLVVALDAERRVRHICHRA